MGRKHLGVLVSVDQQILLWLVCVVDSCALCRVPVVFPFVSQASKIATLFGVGVGLLLTGMYVYRYQVVYPGGQNRFILPAARVAIFFLGVYGAHWLVTEKRHRKR